MNNQRNDYRHVFPPPERLSVRIQAGSQLMFRGEMLDLSLGGLSVQQPNDSSPAQEFPSVPLLRPGEKIQVMFTLPGENQLITLECLIVHTRKGILGLQILPLAEDEAEAERQKTLWRFLLEEQRRQIRRLRQPKSP